jgi:hypothetical protein
MIGMGCSPTIAIVGWQLDFGVLAILYSHHGSMALGGCPGRRGGGLGGGLAGSDPPVPSQFVALRSFGGR